MRTLLAGLFLLYSIAATAQPEAAARVLTKLEVSSKTLGKPVRYAVYLPPGYHETDRDYPILYLLHGYTDDHLGWIQFGDVQRIVDEAVADRTIPEMVIVMPDGGVSWYIDSHDADERYQTFFDTEFRPHVERAYRVRAEKRYRAIAGLSMGGYGTLHQCLKNPDTYTAAAAFSAAVFTDAEMSNMPDENYDRTFAPLYGADLDGAARLNDHYRANSVLDLVRAADAESLKETHWYLDCGDDDFLLAGNNELVTLLKAKGVPFEYRVRDGAHNWTYWRTGLVPALQFVGKYFAQY